MYVGDRILLEVPDEIMDMTRNSGMVRRQSLIYGIVVFDLRKGSGIHQKGFWMFPEMFGHENTLSGPKGKAHEAFAKCKRKFCGDQRLDARNPGV